MKIQLITQNIKPVTLNTQTNSNPILKSTSADSFERQNVAFKGSNVPAAFKEKVLASIATKGEEGMDALCTDMPTFRQTLTVVKELLEESRTKFWGIADGDISLASREEAISELITHHNNMENADLFWRKLWQKNTKTGNWINTMLETIEDRRNLIKPIIELTGRTMQEMLLQPHDLRMDQTVAEWVSGFLKD